PTITVQLIDDDVLQVLEKLHPLGMVRQDARVEHVGVADDDVSLRTDRPASVLRSVAVIGKGLEVSTCELNELVKLFHLVLCQRLRWKQIESARIRVRNNGVQYRDVVTKRFA